MNIEIQDILQDTWARFIRSENLVPLLIASVIVLVGGALSLGVLLGPLMVGFIGMCVRVMNQEAVEVGQVTDGFSRFGAAFVLAVLMILAMVLTACTIIGPLAVALFTMYAFHILAVDEDASAVDAIKASYEMVKTNFTPSILVFLIGMAINSLLSGTVILAIPAYAFALLLTTALFVRLGAPAHATSSPYAHPV